MPLGAQSSYETSSGLVGSGPRTKRENRVGVIIGVLASRQIATPPSNSDHTMIPWLQVSTRQLSPARGTEI